MNSHHRELWLGITSGLTLALTLGQPLLGVARAPSDETKALDPGPPATDVVLEVGGDLPAGSDELRAFRWAGERFVPVAAAKIHAAGARIVLRGECREGWSYLVQTRQRISLPVTVPVGGCSTAVGRPLRLLPTARLTGRVTPPRGWSLPDEGRVSVGTCPSTKEPQGTGLGPYPATVGNDGAWSADLPAGCLVARLEIPPFVPVELGRVTAHPGGTVQLGRAVLRAGATLTVPVISDLDGTPVEGASIDLIPEDGVEKAALATYGGKQPPSAFQSRTDRTGLALLRGVAPGTYYVLARAASEPSSFTFEGPVTVDGIEERRLDTVALPAPARLSVDFEVPEDLPGEPHFNLSAAPKVGGRVLHELARWSELHQGEEIRFADLPGGIWHLEVTWRAPQGATCEVVEKDVDLLPGIDNQVDLDVERHLFRGRLTRNGEGVEGYLHFRPEWEGFAGAIPAILTGATGDFAVFLPKPGYYLVTVGEGRSSDGEEQALIPDVDFRDPSKFVKIRFPEGRIEGWVETIDGEPAAGVNVSGEARLDWAPESRVAVALPAMPLFGKTDENGRFALAGLARGRWALEAFGKEVRSRVAAVDLQQDQAVTGVRLVLEPPKRLSGRVVNARGEPVAGAFCVLMLEPTLENLVPKAAVVRTGGDGRFSLNLPPESGGNANLTVDGSAIPRTVRRVPIGEDLVIRLPSTGGRVVVKGKGMGDRDDPIARADLDRLRLVGQDGGFLPLLPAFGSRAQVGDQRYVIPNLAPGHWRMVQADHTFSTLNLLLAGGGAVLPSLAEFDVVAGASQEITIRLRRPHDGDHAAVVRIQDQ